MSNNQYVYAPVFKMNCHMALVVDERTSALYKLEQYDGCDGEPYLVLSPVIEIR